MADKITTSTGRVVRAKYTGQDGTASLYRCYDLRTEEYLGWCACNGRGQFGPICESPFVAGRRMANIARSMGAMKNAYAPWVSGLWRYLGTLMGNGK